MKLRYAPNLPLALDGFSLSVKPGEKVGIVGRTGKSFKYVLLLHYDSCIFLGAGKSSILQALFRTVELEFGQVTIDGVGIENLDLAMLR